MMRIDLESCTIRSWRADDAANLAWYANNRRIWRNLRDAFPHPYTLIDAENWLDFVTSQRPEASFAIEVEGHAVGSIGLLLKPDVERVCADVGYWLGEPFWGRGIVTAALRTFTAYAFDTHDILRLQSPVFSWNAPSMRVLEKCGYRREGVLRSAAIKDGQVIDLMLYARLRGE